jgi:uncharacterized membrane protein
LNAGELPRLTALVALAATGLLLLGWLGPAALRAGTAGVAMLVLLLLPLGFGIRGLLLARLYTGRWISLVLPFYGAGLLVGAAGNPEARGWITAAAFSVALAFAAVISWVRRAGRGVPRR